LDKPFYSTGKRGFLVSVSTPPTPPEDPQDHQDAPRPSREKAWPLGIDIAKKTFRVTLKLPNGKVRCHSFSNDPVGHRALLDWFQKLGCSLAHACLEATGKYGNALALFIHASGHLVSVVNPRAIHHYAKSKMRRAKTDPVDATLLADYCAAECPALWTPLPIEIQELQALVRRLESVQQMRTMEHNRLTSMDPAAPDEWVEQRIKRHLVFIDQELEEIRAAICAHIKKHPALKKDSELLCSIPSIAETTAAWLLAELGDWRLFRGARQVSAFAGLCPRLHQSGDATRAGVLSKQGNARLRRCLYMPAMCALRFNPVVREFGERLGERGKKRKVVIAAAMRKLLHIAYGVLKSGTKFSAGPATA
jgi:transposase